MSLLSEAGDGDAADPLGGKADKNEVLQLRLVSNMESLGKESRQLKL